MTDTTGRSLDVDEMERCAFASTNNSPELPLHKHWYRKGVADATHALREAQRPAAQDDRAAFEAWFDSEYVELARIVGDGVAASIRNVSRNAWQVALASRPVPPPISEAQREPLTDEQLHDVLRQVAESIDSGHIVMTHWPQVARATERAITGQSPKE